MAKPTNTVLGSDEVGIREDLEEVVYRVAVEETPFIANTTAGKRVTNPYGHSWELDTLAAADTTNYQPEGNNVVAQAVVQPTRVKNVCQISFKAVSVSGTASATDEVDSYSSKATQLVKKGLELRRDLEAIYLNPQSASLTDPRKMGTFPAWLTTNVSAGSGYTAASLSSQLPVLATDGTQRAFTEALLKTTQASCFTVRGRTPKVLMLGVAQKSVFSAFTGLASSRFNVQKDAPTSIIGSADVYVGEFGNLTTMVNIFQRNRDAWLIDFDMVERMPFRPMHEEDLGKLGDADQSFLVTEGTLKVNNEAAHGAVVDLS